MSIAAEFSSDAFHAIAHPGRRQLLELLQSGEKPVNTLAETFAMSRPAVSQHLKVLLDAGLVTERRDGRQRLYKLEPTKLARVHDWVSQFEKFWSEKLDALGKFLEDHPQ
jgi:DNA-binding transcriptional ArsR family regulator